ncbi:MAG: MmgE/PrpD family protein [Dehalococcoidia bacterium]|nr:MmgE/PrpD family protein [Dehalococcoidia bacterium]
MEQIMQGLAKFVTETKYADLPERVIHEVKRILLDCAGDAISANECDRGKIAVKLAKRLGGATEATILGTCDRVSVANAAFADGELIDAEDYAPVGCGIHSSPHILPPVLVMAESLNISGQDLLLAIAVTYEVSARISAALTPIYESIRKADGRYEIRHPAVCGAAYSILPGAAGAGKVMGLDPETLANAIGIAGYWAQPNTFRKWEMTAPARMTKSDPAGWSAQGSVQAALLASMGYEGDTDLFDTEFGFGKFSGSERWRPERILAGIGQNWYLRMAYKDYPAGWCCGGANPLLIAIMKENNLTPDDIEHIHVMTHPLEEFKLWQENRMRTQDDVAFNVPYLLACAAYGVRKQDYYDMAVRNDPRIKAFMKKIDPSIDEEFKQKWAALQVKDFWGTSYMQIEVKAKGKTFFKSLDYQKGADHESSRMTDEELIQKFRDNAERTIPTHKIEKAIKAIFELEKVPQVSDLMELVTV